MTQTDSHLSNVSFAQFELPESVNRGLADAGFDRCTPIQAEVLPHALAGRDVAGQAQTGTGKTAAFLVATFDWLHRHPPAAGRKPHQPRAFMVAPTRELAIQIHRDAETLGRHTDLKLALAYGGTGYEAQRQAIADGCDVLIGTPGRLIDYLKQGVYDLSQLQVAVLDEADRMFDLGFIADIRYLFRKMPPPDKRLSMLFSATLSFRVTELAYEHMNNPRHVQADAEQVTADRVEQRLYHPANDEKIPLLVGLLNKLEAPRSLVFVNTKRGAELVWRYLEGNGIKSAVLSGDVPQLKRQRLLERFQKGELPVLIATDVAARGLHITYSTSICRSRARTTSTASAAPPVPARAATPSASPARTPPSTCPRSRNTSAASCHRHPSRAHCWPIWRRRRHAPNPTSRTATAARTSAAAAATGAVTRVPDPTPSRAPTANPSRPRTRGRPMPPMARASPASAAGAARGGAAAPAPKPLRRPAQRAGSSGSHRDD